MRAVAALLLAHCVLAAAGPRTDASWIGNLHAVMVDIGQLETLRRAGSFKTPEELVDHLMMVSHGHIKGIVFYAWPGYLFPHERWDSHQPNLDGSFDVPRLVQVCHARGLKVVAMFNEAAFAEFCAHTARAGFDALYLIEYNLPRDDMSAPALAYFKARAGINVPPGDAWAYIQKHCLREWLQARDERLLEFLAAARSSANAVRPVPFGALCAFASVGKEPRLWQEEPLLRRVLEKIDFAGVYCRWFHWKLPPDATEKTWSMIRRPSPFSYSAIPRAYWEAMAKEEHR